MQGVFVMNRRDFLRLAGLAGLGMLINRKARAMGKAKKDEENFPFQLSDEEWKKRLTPDQYRVLRTEGTEPAGTSPLNKEKHHGVYLCAGCSQVLFNSENKYESGTGWPSFWKPASDKAVGLNKDYKLIAPRTEVHCSNCGGHLGHVFEDGPPPTGLRYCMNGAALTFRPE
jgi:peptide-methionine (R)-S-oxide reductase